jgi:hypothetical protein
MRDFINLPGKVKKRKNKDLFFPCHMQFWKIEVLYEGNRKGRDRNKDFENGSNTFKINQIPCQKIAPYPPGPKCP